MRVFHDLEPPRPVSRVRLGRDGGEPRWHAVTGWTRGNAPCPALGRKVDDSGEGVVILVSGGDAGLRFQSAEGPGPWALAGPGQWGAPFLLIADASDLAWA